MILCKQGPMPCYCRQSDFLKELSNNHKCTHVKNNTRPMTENPFKYEVDPGNSSPWFQWEQYQIFMLPTEDRRKEIT